MPRGFFTGLPPRVEEGGKLKRLRFFATLYRSPTIILFSIEEDLTKDKEQSPMTITKESSLQPQKKFCHIFVPIVMLLMIKYD